VAVCCVSTSRNAWNRTFAEQALASAKNYRKLPDAECINDIVLEQGLEESAAAVDLNLAGNLCLGPCSLQGDVALQQVGVAPSEFSSVREKTNWNLLSPQPVPRLTEPRMHLHRQTTGDNGRVL
jgi:hypothetical protein